MVILLLNLSAVTFMFPSFQDNTSVSPEYREFMEEYDKMRTYSAQVSDILVLIKTLESKSTQLTPLYIQAVKAHLCAVNACRRMVAIYEQIFQKYWSFSDRQDNRIHKNI